MDRQTYQRDLKSAWVDEIASGWDFRLAMLIVVSQRADGALYVVDGQHRVMAAQVVGLPKIHCQVFRGLSVEDEANLFLKMNWGRKRMERLDYWRAAIAGKDPTITSLSDILKKHDYQLHASGRNQPGHLACVQTIRQIGMNRAGEARPERLDMVLDFISRAWPDERQNGNATVLKGVHLFLQKYGALISVGHAVAKFHSIEVSDVMKRATAVREATGGSQASAFARAMQILYDKGMRGNRLEESSVLDDQEGQDMLDVTPREPLQPPQDAFDFSRSMEQTTPVETTAPTAVTPAYTLPPADPKGPQRLGSKVLARMSKQRREEYLARIGQPQQA